jgi:ComF family protein
MADPRLLPLLPRDLPSSPMRRIADGILNLFFPGSCLACSAPVSRLREFGVCASCWAKAKNQRITAPRCPACGLPYQVFGSDEAHHLCGKCSLRLPPYSGARAFGYYSAELSRLIQALKFEGRRNLAGPLAALLASTLSESWAPQEFDVIVPVPLHARRKRERGYNQAMLLSCLLGRLAGLYCREDALARVRSTLPQVGLSNADRARNVRHAFRCVRPDAVKGLRVLLVDDVMTTGATFAAAAEALLAGGALRVSVLAVARAVA